MTFMEIFFPIILMFICYLIKLAFDSTKVTWEDEGSLDEYLIDKGNFGFDYNVYGNLMKFNTLLKDGALGDDPDKYFERYFTLMNIADESVKETIKSRILNIKSSLSVGEGIWKYIDPLEETHDINVTTIIGLPVKPITMICYNRFTIAFVGFEENTAGIIHCRCRTHTVGRMEVQIHGVFGESLTLDDIDVSAARAGVYVK